MSAALAFDDGVRRLRLNPADPETFPWLSHIAPLFETYHFSKLKLTLDFPNPTSVSGRFVIAVDYDAADDVPGSEGDLLNYQGSLSGPLWGSHEVDLLATNLRKRETYYTARVPSNETIGRRQTDVGNIWFYIYMTDAAHRPYIWIDYTVHFQTPQIPTTAEGCAAEWTYTDNAITDTEQFKQSTYTGAEDAPIVEGSARLVDTQDSDSLYIKAGKYLMHRFLSEIGGTISNMVPPTTSGTNTVQNLSNELYASSDSEGVIISALDIEDENTPINFASDTTVAGPDQSRILLQPISDKLYEILTQGLSTKFFKSS